MKWLLNIILCLIVSGWIFLTVQWLRSSKKEHGWKAWLTSIAALFAMIGGLGFFGTMLSALGALNWLPNSFEWPVGFATGVVVTGDNYFVVPHTPSGRVQIYDRNWKFARGWYVDGGGGAFKLRTPQPDRVEVITARGEWHFVFSISGKLLSKENYPPGSYDSFPTEGKSFIVPTAPWLWVFSHPILCWLCILVGFVLSGATKKRRRKKNTRARKDA